MRRLSTRRILGDAFRPLWGLNGTPSSGPSLPRRTGADASLGRRATPGGVAQRESGPFGLVGECGHPRRPSSEPIVTASNWRTDEGRYSGEDCTLVA